MRSGLAGSAKFEELACVFRSAEVSSAACSAGATGTAAAFLIGGFTTGLSRSDAGLGSLELLPQLHHLLIFLLQHLQETRRSRSVSRSPPSSR